MSQPAYRAKLKILGASTRIRGAALSARVTPEGLVLTVINSDNQFIDDSQPFTLRKQVGAVQSTPNVVCNIKNKFFGEFICPNLNSITANTTYRIDFSFLPSTQIIGANQFSLDISGDILDSTAFGDGGFRRKEYGLIDVAASITRHDNFDKKFKTIKSDRDKLLLDVAIADSDRAIGLFVVESIASSGEVASLEAEAINLQLAGEPRLNFSWRTS